MDFLFKPPRSEAVPASLMSDRSGIDGVPHSPGGVLHRADLNLTLSDWLCRQQGGRLTRKASELALRRTAPNQEGGIASVFLHSECEFHI